MPMAIAIRRHPTIVVWETNLPYSGTEAPGPLSSRFFFIANTSEIHTVKTGSDLPAVAVGTEAIEVVTVSRNAFDVSVKLVNPANVPVSLG